VNEPDAPTHDHREHGLFAFICIAPKQHGFMEHRVTHNHPLIPKPENCFHFASVPSDGRSIVTSPRPATPGPG
jgi:hypothetical protein